jgi:hypothetical protein
MRGEKRRRDAALQKCSEQPIPPVPQEFNKALIPQELKLLPNLVPHMPGELE